MNTILFIIIMTGLGFILGLSIGKVEDCIVKKDGKDVGNWLFGAFIAIMFISVMFSIDVGLAFEKKIDRIEGRIENMTPEKSADENVENVENLIQNLIPTDTTHLVIKVRRKIGYGKD